MSRPAVDVLLSGLAAGNERAFEELYDRYAARLYRAALAMLGSPADAEDAVQEVFVAMVRSRRKLAALRDLTAYLFASLRRAAGRCAARRARGPIAHLAGDEPAAPPAGNATEPPQAERLDRALRALPDEQREVIALKFDAGLTFREIAGALGVSANTAASRYRYALEKLRASLEA